MQVSKVCSVGQRTRSSAWEMSLLCPQQAGEPSASKVKKQKKRPHPLPAEDSLKALPQRNACFQLQIIGVRVYKKL